MQGFAEVSEVTNAPPPGTYSVVIVTAEAGLSTKGNAQLALTLEITDGKYKEYQFMDWVGTDPRAKGSFISKGKLRTLLKGTPADGLADAGPNNEVPDAVIAQALVGRRLNAIIDNEPRKMKNEEGKRTDTNMTTTDPLTGQLITVMNASVKGYSVYALGAQAPIQGQGQFVPAQGQAMAQPIQQVPQYAQPTQQIQQPIQGQGQFAPAPQVAQMAQGGFQTTAALPPWQQAPANGATASEQAAGTKKRKVLNLEQGQQG